MAGKAGGAGRLKGGKVLGREAGPRRGDVSNCDGQLWTWRMAELIAFSFRAGRAVVVGIPRGPTN